MTSGLVLCVDDEPRILRSLAWVLQKQYRVMTAESGQAALNLLGSHDFDVIISDQRMPGMLGCEFLREARKLCPRAMRILLTGYSDMQAILGSVNEGEVFRFLNKPWNIPDLLRIVGEAAEISRLPVPDTAEPAPAGLDQALPCEVLVLDEGPDTLAMLREQLGPGANLIEARSLGEAITALDSPEIGVVVSDIQVGGADVARLLKLLKSNAPQIVSLVVSQRSDSQDVIDLINQGQVHRFLFKPVKAGYLKHMVNSAVHKHVQLRANPQFARRHQVEALSAQEKNILLKDAKAAYPGESATGQAGGFLQRFRSGFRRLFGS